MAKFFVAFMLATLLAGAIVAGSSGSSAGAQPVPSASPMPVPSGVVPSPSATPTGM